MRWTPSFVQLGQALALLSFGCRESPPSPPHTTAGAPATIGSARARSAEPTWAELPPQTPACQQHCARQDAADYRMRFFCGGSQHHMDERYRTPACAEANNDHRAVQQSSPSPCSCRLSNELRGKGAGSAQCTRYCEAARPSFKAMYTACAGAPGSPRYGRRECWPASNAFYGSFSFLGMSYCDCDYERNPTLLLDAGTAH